MVDSKREQMRSVLRRHLREHRPRRHPAEVTSDRLGDALDRWPERFDGEDRDMIGHIRDRLQEIAEGRDEG